MKNPFNTLKMSKTNAEHVEFGHKTCDYGIAESGFTNTYRTSQYATFLCSFSTTSSEESSRSSSSTSSDDFSPRSPTPSARFFHSGQAATTCNYQLGHSYSADLSKLRTTPPDIGNAPFVEGFDFNEPYLGHAPFVEGFELPFVSEGSVPDGTPKQTPWEYMEFGGDPSSSESASLVNEAFALCQTGIDGKLAGGFGESVAHSKIAPVFCMEQNQMESSTSTVLPSQTLKYPNASPPNLATPFVSPIKPANQLSSCGPSSQDVSKFDFPNAAEHVSVGPYVSSDTCKFASQRIVDDGLTAERTGFANHHSGPATWRKRRRLETETEGKDLVPKGQIGGPKIESFTRAAGFDRKEHCCHSCRKGFDRQEHLTRHKKTNIHLETLKDLGIPSLDPPPPTTPCPFCPRRFNRSDNLKPHMLTHMHEDNKNHRNSSCSVEQSIRLGQDRIDPRINPTRMSRKRPTKTAKTKQTA